VENRDYVGFFQTPGYIKSIKLNRAIEKSHKNYGFSDEKTLRETVVFLCLALIVRAFGYVYTHRYLQFVFCVYEL
jgi:hypothetical protein